MTFSMCRLASAACLVHSQEPSFCVMTTLPSAANSTLCSMGNAHSQERGSALASGPNAGSFHQLDNASESLVVDRSENVRGMGARGSDS